MGSIHTGLKSSKTRVGRAESFDSHESWAPVFVFFSFGMLHILLLAAVVAPVEWRKTRIPNLFCIIYFDSIYGKLFGNSPIWDCLLVVDDRMFCSSFAQKRKEGKAEEKEGVSLYSHVHGFPSVLESWQADELRLMINLPSCWNSWDALHLLPHSVLRIMRSSAMKAARFLTFWA